MADSPVSVGGSLAYAWSLLSQHWRAIWGVLALNALAWTVCFAGGFAANPELVNGGSVAMLFTTFAAYGAVVRLGADGARRDDPDYRLGGHGIQWRRMELRMLGANLLVALFMIFFVVLLFVFMAAPVMGILLSRGFDPAGPAPTIATQADVKRLLGEDGALIVMVEYVIALAVLLFVSVRLSLALVASAESGRIAVFRTWRLTKRQFWRIFLPTLLLNLPYLVTVAVVFRTGAGAPGGTQLAPGQVLGYALLSGILVGAVSQPMLAAVQLYFYKRLGPIIVTDAERR